MRYCNLKSLRVGILLSVGFFIYLMQTSLTVHAVKEDERTVRAVTDSLISDSLMSRIQQLIPTPADKEKMLIDDILNFAFEQKGKPYGRGSRGPSRFDCSGFTKYVFTKFDFNLNPSSRSQFLQGDAVSRNELKKGDLVFFKGSNSGSKAIGHVGLVSHVDESGNFKFIHASCDRGICEDNSSSYYYAKRFVGARRIINLSVHS